MRLIVLDRYRNRREGDVASFLSSIGVHVFFSLLFVAAGLALAFMLWKL